uniref:Uncharacterized protein n=1 Tax=Fagus sylvatica TaxID=28930 RepID=A0A2N9EN31_FAGSY
MAMGRYGSGFDPPRPVKKPIYRPALSVSTGTCLTRPNGYPTRFEEAYLCASREEMENLVLDDPLNNGKSFLNYCSAMSSLSDTHHPLSSSILVNSAESDPLLSPPPYRDLRNPNVPESSYIEPPAYADVIFSPFDGDTVNDVNGVESPSRNSEKTKRDRERVFNLMRILG